MDGKEESQDVYFDLTSNELVNVGHLFETDQTFFSRRDLEAFVRDVGKKNNICISVLSSKGGEGKGLGNAVVYLGCERSLTYRKNKAKGSVPEGVANKVNSGTKRCNCPFRLKGKEISAASWKLFVKDGNHNHNFPTYNVGRSIISRLSKDEKIKAKELTRAHVPPSQILISIKNENKDNLTTMKQMYYYRQTLRKEEMKGRSVIQQLLRDLCKESYFFSYQVSPINNMVTDLFFANKKAVQLLHQFYYVLIMDCTYKTNRYKMPLLEIIGIVPTGKNFVVGLAFLQDEKKGSFEWALQCTKDLFNPNQIPQVIVTDREFALIHAFVGNWNRIVYAETEAEYEEKVQHFHKIFASHPNLVTYVQDTWLIHAKKFVHAYTNKVLHFGNRTTNRVESAHNSLKRFLRTSTGSLDTIWSRVHSYLQLQENEIKASFFKSTNKDLHITVLHLLTELTGKISHIAIKKIIKEYSRHGVTIDPATCGCYLRTTHGLPCTHEMRLLDEEGKGIELNNVHIFWRTLHMEGNSFFSDDHQKQFEDDDEILWHYFNIMMQQSPEVKKMYVSQLEKMIHPETLIVEEPFSDRKSKGRPKSRSSTKRDPSYFEYVDKETSSLKSGKKPKGPAMEESIPSEIPKFVVPYIHEYINVSADGNCGYRSVAHQIYGSEDQWRRVRTDLHDFIEMRLDYWTRIWHKSIDEARVTLKRVNYCESPCSYEYWMSMDEMGPIIATIYNVILVALDPIDTNGYLDIFAIVPMINNCPVPEIYRFWYKFREDSVHGWDAPLMARIEKWTSIRG